VPSNSALIPKEVKMSHGNMSVSSKKRKLDIEDVAPFKKVKFAAGAQVDHIHDMSLIGLTWDGTNYSCAYDSLFTILHGIWVSDPERLECKIQFDLSKNELACTWFS
jgi:hypothetical protein